MYFRTMYSRKNPTQKPPSRRSRLPVLALSLALTLSACQPTPEQEIVAGKDGEQLESIIAAAPSGAEPSAAAACGDSGTRAAEETSYSARYTPEENVVFTVEATVTDYPGSMPVYRAQPHEFTSEEVRALADYFFEGNTAYETRQVMTRQEIEQRILDLTQWANDTEGLLACANNEEEAQEMKEQYEEEIALWEERYQTAPEDYTPPECDWQFHPATYFDEELDLLLQLDPDDVCVCRVDKDYYIKATAEMDDSKGEIEALNRTDSSYNAHSFHFRRKTSVGEYMDLGSTGTQEEAEALARSVLEDLGMADRWVLRAIERSEPSLHSERAPEGYAFALWFQPVVDGIPLNDIPYLSVDWDSESYAPAYSEESLTMTIADGQVAFFDWVGPLDIVSTENAAVAELSFEEIMERFETQMAVTYPLSRYEYGGESTHIVGMEMRITQICHGLARVNIPDDPDAYYLLPAWSFYGITGFQNNTQDSVDFGTGLPGVEPQPEHRLTLNALDGTVIGDQGY